jgi:hypothetical protein
MASNMNSLIERCAVTEAGGEVRGSAQVEAMSQPVTQQQDPTPLGIGPSSEAGEGGRTLDIHVGNVTLYH